MHCLKAKQTFPKPIKRFQRHDCLHLLPDSADFTTRRSNFAERRKKIVFLVDPKEGKQNSFALHQPTKTKIYLFSS